MEFGVASLTNAAVANNVYDEIFVARFNSAGVPQWAKRGGGEGNDEGSGIGVDAAGISGGVIQFTDPASTGATLRFYRLRLP